jgi:hypothetical protein
MRQSSFSGHPERQPDWQRAVANIVAAVSLVLALSPSGALADDDPNRNVKCPADRIGVTEAQFRTCFLPVQPEPGHNPSGMEQQANKTLLLPCLQAIKPNLTNHELDVAMDACRPEGPNGG